MTIINYQRVGYVFSGVGTSWSEYEVTKVPKEFKIKRARAEIIDGSLIGKAPAPSVGTQVALAVREKSNPDYEIDVALEYSLTNTPLDSREDIFFLSQSVDSLNSSLGSVFLAVKCDSGSDNTVQVSLDIEVVG